MLKNQIATSWRHIRRVPFQAMSAIFVLTITFFVMTMLSVAVYSSGQILKYFETRPQIIAFLQESVTDQDIESFRNELGTDAKVKDIRFVSKEEALEIYKKATADNPLLSELVSPAIFPASIEFSLTDLKHADEVISSVRQKSFVESVGFTASLGNEDSLSGVIKRLKDISWYIKAVGGGFVLFLIGTSFLVLIMVIGMRITSRRTEFETLELLGATPGYIRKPVIFEAMTYAFTGVFVGWTGALLLVLYATPSLIGYFGDITVLPKDTVSLLKIFGIILGGEAAMGLILSLSGSILALSRVKRK